MSKDNEDKQLSSGLFDVVENLRKRAQAVNYLTPDTVERIKKELTREKMEKILFPVFTTEKIRFNIDDVLREFKRPEVTAESLQKRYQILSDCLSSFNEAHIIEKIQYFILLYFIDEAEQLS